MNGKILRKYGVSQTITFKLFEVDGVDLRIDATFDAGDLKIMKDEGAEANTTNLPTDEGQGYSIVLTATEMQAARISVYFVDQTATKVWLDTTIEIETYGNASAQHAADLDDSVRLGLTALPAIAVEGAGGLFTRGTGAGQINQSANGQIDTNIQRLNNVTQSLLDLVDFADAGYDPATNKVQGVALVDTVTANTDMRGTDGAALANVLGALADAAAAGDPTSADTLMQYIKQLINVLVGTTGVTTFPAEAAPANNVSLAEVIRAIANDVIGINGEAMRGTNSANTVVPDAAGVAPTAVEIRQEMDTNSVDLNQIQSDIGALNNLSTAQVLTQVNAALDTAISELGVAVPTATPTLRTGLILLYMMARNKTIVQTSGTDALEIHNDAGTLITKKLLSDDGSDFTESEMS